MEGLEDGETPEVLASEYTGVPTDVHNDQNADIPCEAPAGELHAENTKILSDIHIEEHTELPSETLDEERAEFTPEIPAKECTDIPPEIPADEFADVPLEIPADEFADVFPEIPADEHFQESRGRAPGFREKKWIKPVLKKPNCKRESIKLNVRVISPGFDKEEEFEIPQKVYREPNKSTVNTRWASSERSGLWSREGKRQSRPQSRPQRRHTVSLPNPPLTDHNDSKFRDSDVESRDVEKSAEVDNSNDDDTTPKFGKKLQRNSIHSIHYTPRLPKPHRRIARSNTIPDFSLENIDLKKIHEDNVIRRQLEQTLRRSHTVPFEISSKPKTSISFGKHMNSILLKGKEPFLFEEGSGDDISSYISNARRKSVSQSGLWQLASSSVYAFKANKSHDFSDVAMALVTKQNAVVKMRHKIEKKMDLPEGRFERIAALKQKMESIERKFRSLKMINAASKKADEKIDDYDEEECRQPKFSKPGEAMGFFRKCCRMIMIVLKWIDLIMDDQNRLEKELKSFVDIANEVEASTVSQSMLDSGLSFDKNMYKAKREISLTADHRKTLTTRWNFRSQEMIQQVMHGLQTLRSLSEYPLHTQEKLCKVAWYQTIGPKKAILRQGHKAESFYFILSGVAYVKKMIYDEKTKETRVNTMARLTKGMSFGEIGLIFNTLRTATVESASSMELLVIGKEDFNRIFMKAENPDEEAEHVQFLRQVPLMQTWPIEKLENEPGACLLHFFKRGTLITEDGKTSEWLYFIKSGSCEVLKNLKSTKAKKAGQVQKKLDPMCDVILPELGNAPSPRVNTGQTKKRREFVMSPEVYNDMSKYYDQLKKKLIGEQAQEKIRLDRMDVPTPDPERVRLTLPRITGTNHTGHLVTLCEEDEDNVESRVPSGYSSVKTSNLRIPPYKCAKPEDSPGVSLSPLDKYTKLTLGKLSAHFMFPTTDKIQSMKPSPRDSPDFQEQVTSRRENIFVMIELLHPKDSFGINTLTGWGSDDIDDMLNESPPTALVSNGAEVVMLSKKVFLKYMNDDVRCMLRENVRAYPKETVMQDNLQRKLDWDEYKSTVIHDWVSTRTILREINTIV
ncbi:uncharacterized protein LOC117328939 isoform X2 [Pecten maximus]|uniref:uncharacterized protein LOC117328939 isoform X2 n=1 Tax=Pecten maximus TaxID=6579 RepID=UPI0014583A38|nr:uncharacterized protein LOC117328939 isoform X2 [Pecten maximus]